MKHNIKGVAFDLDGTLYPNYRLNIRLVPFILKEWRLISAFGKARVVIREEQGKGILAQGDFYEYQAEITAKLLSAHEQEQQSEPLKEKIERLIYRGWEPMFKNIKLFKGVHQTLETLRKAGYKLGLLSDFPPEIKLEYLNLTGYWDTVQCSEHCNALKPHPLAFTKLASAMSLPPENILYVGNSHSYDVTGAASAGMKTAWIKPALYLGSKNKKPKPDFSFSNYRQLYDFMLQ
jgi:putative hydrolase of the HAD superfamily